MAYMLDCINDETARASEVSTYDMTSMLGCIYDETAGATETSPRRPGLYAGMYS